MSELKPCPFCGGEAARYENENFSDRYRINCMDCGAEVTDEELFLIDGKWNARHNEEDEKQRASYYQGELYKITQQLAVEREEIAALKNYASKGDEEIKKLSPLVEIVSSQKQRIQQLEEQIAVRNELDNDFYQELEEMENLTHYEIYKAIIKHKESK